jgi:hypothetical protein
MRDKFTLTQDPGHGWMLVTMQELHELGLKESDISPYSYQRGPYVALEEDCDMGTFFAAHNEKYEFVPLIETDEDGAKVRGWASYGTKRSAWEAGR